MNVSCPECRSIFRIDPAKVPTTGVRARCSVCGGILAIGGGSLPVSVTPYGGVPRTAGTPVSVPAVGSVPPIPVPRLTPAISVPTVTPAPPAHPTPVIPPPAIPTPVMPPVAIPTPVAATPAIPEPVVPPVAIPTPVAATPAIPTPVVPAPAVEPAPAPAVPPGTPAFEPPPVVERRPINPFLQVDPVQRARRLARALVSDLVAYHPQKREEGLRDGTLRQLFREDIKKSYEEYVEQVGQEVAERSPFFQDALNDILAGGRRLF